MESFFNFIRRNKKTLVKSTTPREFCLTLAKCNSHAVLSGKVAAAFDQLSNDERNYAVSGAYALLMDQSRRKELSAYFTPPALADAALQAAEPFLSSVAHPTILDPACGGGSFLSPVARSLIHAKRKRGASIREACEGALKAIQGVEIDSGLAGLSRLLLASTLEAEFGYKSKRTGAVVDCADALTFPKSKKYDLVIGNPPYGKVSSKTLAVNLETAGLANLGGHTNLYTLFLLRSLEWVRPGGGLVFVLPPSFVAGPYFAGLRREILHRAEVIRVDMHEQRENLFLGAVQDVCLLTLRRRAASDAHIADLSHSYELGVIDAAGVRRSCGHGVAKDKGEPWVLPAKSCIVPLSEGKAPASNATVKAATIADYGYRVRVGKVVPTRERALLHKRRESGDLPLIWASSIRPDGGFDFHASKRLGNAQWYGAGGDYKSATTRQAVLVQRTSNRDQKRLLNAAAVPQKFQGYHKRGFIAENHVIIVEAVNTRPLVSPSVVARVLNSAIVNERFSTVSGSYSVSAKLLERMTLPMPLQVKKLVAEGFDHDLRRLFVGLDEVLKGCDRSELARDAQDALNKAGHLNSGSAVHQNASLKRRAAA